MKEIPRLFQNQNPVEGYQVKDNIRGIVTIFWKNRNMSGVSNSSESFLFDNTVPLSHTIIIVLIAMF